MEDLLVHSAPRSQTFANTTMEQTMAAVVDPVVRHNIIIENNYIILLSARSVCIVRYGKLRNDIALCLAVECSMAQLL